MEYSLLTIMMRMVSFFIKTKTGQQKVFYFGNIEPLVFFVIWALFICLLSTMLLKFNKNI